MLYCETQVSKQRDTYRKKRGKIPVTVCVAAICENGFIIGASDRMVTSGDIQFEPPLQKIWRPTDSIAIMTAGDAPIQNTIIMNVANELYDRYGSDRKMVVPVLEVADLYSRFHGEEQAKEAARRYLAPFNLTLETFLSRQQELSPDFIRQVGNNMLSYTIPDVEAIIAGIDAGGACLYQIINGEITCQNSIGFVAIGVGGWHASSQFMFRGHTRYNSIEETLFLTYSAKKRAEVAPGVGEVTDMFFIGPETGSYTVVYATTIDKLEEIYQEVVKGEAEFRAYGIRKVKEYGAEVARENEETRATLESQLAETERDAGHQPNDKEEIRDGSEKGEPENEPTVH
jgi:20S proteasome alpha/beta subunit